MSDAHHDGSANATIETNPPDPKSGSTFYIGLVGTLVTIVIVLFLETLFYRTVSAEDARKAGPDVPVVLEQMRERQQAELTGYAWVDQANGVVAIPIERAMELVVAEHSTAASAE